MWQWEDTETQRLDTTRIVDVSFRLEGDSIPFHYQQTLFESLKTLAPWLLDDRGFGVLMRLAVEEGNGWYRDGAQEQDYFITRRSRMVLRLSSSHVPRAESLVGRSLVFKDQTVQLKSASVMALQAKETVYARHVALGDDETQFMQEVYTELKSLGVACKKILCGRSRQILLDAGLVSTRSLMLAGLRPEDALLIQQAGLGPFRQYGCGLFVPYKAAGN